MNLLTTDQATELILQNQIVAVPTETVYGLFGLANSMDAINNVYKIKNRPLDNPLICHFYSLEQILEYVQRPPEYICKLINLIGPSPLTYILKIKINSPLTLCCVGLTTICCRIPDNQLALELLQKIKVPLFGPSANTSTKVSGVTAAMIDQDLGDKIAGIIDGGQCDIGLESTIVDTTEIGKIKILRPGMIGKIELENYLKQIEFGNIKVVENQKTQLVTPGAKYRHYSPKTKLYLEKIDNIITENKANLILHKPLLQPKVKQISQPIFTIGLVQFQKENPNYISLGSSENLTQASANFYYNLYKLDQLNVKSCIFDLQSYEFICSSDLSIAKALFNRLEKVLVVP